ncbi:MAG: endo-1,4-beta-xylanase [Planctomycetota bacterium]|nr:endo-1,4-beta-xylanase [Planctomycetota bacterium]
MLRFAVYDEKGRADSWPLINAHLLGPDDLVLRGKIAFKDGRIVCKTRESQAAALSLQYDAGRMGRLMLQTCLLPPRKKPYILSVELARHRIKMFIAKSEEWQMFDLSEDHPAMRHWEQARQGLTAALTADNPVKADRAARAALNRAIEATERLALAHAEILLHRRYATRPASSVTLGVRIWPESEGKELKELIASNFDLLIIPLRWKDLEVEEGVYNWERVDRWMEWAGAEGKPIVAGPLLDFSRRALPEWMYVWQHDYDTCRDLVYEYMERVVHRYRGLVGMWNIASGLNVNENFEFTPVQILDLARTASLLVRQSRKGARTMIELREPFGEHGANRRRSIPPLTFVDQLVQGGVKFDALGVQLLFGQQDSGRASRDLAQISSLLDKFFLLETPVLVSALGVPSQPIDEEGGWWHEPWSPDVQSRWIARLFPVAMSKPFVESIFWTDLVDHDEAALPKAALIDESGRARPAFARLTGMRKRLRKPLGPLNLRAEEVGS